MEDEKIIKLISEALEIEVTKITREATLLLVGGFTAKSDPHKRTLPLPRQNVAEWRTRSGRVKRHVIGRDIPLRSKGGFKALPPKANS